MINYSAVSNEVFQILRSFDYTVMMYDDDGMEVYEPEEARRFFAKPENLLVSVVEEGENSRINLYLSGNTDASSVLGLITSLRTTANKYNMIFKDQQWDRDLSVKDFATKNAVRETVEPMELTEGMYGTSRSSYLKLENARMIVRHSSKIDETIAGARCRRVESIFVENAQGERFLFPTKQLAPARAMVQHFNHGGSFADEIGQQITQMAADYSALGQASAYIGINTPVMCEAALSLRQKCRTTRSGMKKCFERLYRESSYDKESGRLREIGTPVLAEDATIAKLREMLAVEGKEISEEIINTIARCVESAQPILEDDYMNEPEEKEDGRSTIKDEKGPTISILGQEVNLDAWNALKSGNLELRVNPESIMGSGPNFRDAQAELGYKLGIVATVVMSSSLFKLFSWASEELMSRDNPSLTKKLMSLANSVLDLAKVSKNVKEGLGFRGSQVIREFEEWFDSLGSESVLGDEPEYMGDVTAVEPTTELGTELSDELSDDITNETMAADITQGYTEGSNWVLNFAQADDAAMVCGGSDSVNRQIGAAVLGGSRNGSVHSIPENGPRQSFEWSIDDTIEIEESDDIAYDPEMDNAQDYMDNDEDMFEGKLTREDILLPKDDVSADLKQEVGHDVDDKDEKDDNELTMERLRKLSGIKIS